MVLLQRTLAVTCQAMDVWFDCGMRVRGICWAMVETDGSFGKNHYVFGFHGGNWPDMFGLLLGAICLPS